MLLFHRGMQFTITCSTLLKSCCFTKRQA
uniref:Uncharacterized protein n=1 Tax=Anguilla anguilla TaxID=7936 RepID=A0A0E9R9W8_ANGAN